MRVGVVGVGFMGAMHAAAWTDTGAELVGFVAETTYEAEPIARHYQVKVFPCLSAMLKEVDVVDICTPTHLHAEMTIQAAEAGKHVICEKPLAHTLEDGQRMIAACRKAGVQLHVAHVVRFFPEYALARAVVTQGKIGKLGTIRLNRGSFRPKKPVGNWFLDESKSGGILLDLMIHDFDYARWLAGEVESVYAKKITAQNGDQPPVDYGLAILKHRSGVLTHVAGAWAYPPPTFRTSFELSGDGGMIDYDSSSTAPIETLLQKISTDAPDVGLPSSPLDEDPYTTEIKEFYAALQGERPARVSAEDGLAALQIALAAIESARSGHPVFLEPLAEVRS